MSLAKSVDTFLWAPTRVCAADDLWCATRYLISSVKDVVGDRLWKLLDQSGSANCAKDFVVAPYQHAKQLS